MAENAQSPASRLGRRVALVIYWAITVSISVASALAVTLQVFAGPARAPGFAACRDGIRALAGAIDRARASAAASEGTEDEALAQFRAALDPEWSAHDGIASLCREKEEDQRALDAIERLRYAEEHAVRREAGELAPLRRRVQSLVDDGATDHDSRSIDDIHPAPAPPPPP